jgi:hypothetical protein
MTAVTGPLLRSRQSRHFVIVIAAQGKVQGIFVTLGDGGFRNYGLGLLRPRRRAPALLFPEVPDALPAVALPFPRRCPSAPSSSSKRLRTSGSARMRTASRWSLAMIGSGVPAGASSAKIANSPAAVLNSTR